MLSHEIYTKEISLENTNSLSEIKGHGVARWWWKNKTRRIVEKKKNITVTAISIYVKNITQTLHVEWRFNENSFVKLLLKQFHSIFVRNGENEEIFLQYFPFFSKWLVKLKRSEKFHSWPKHYNMQNKIILCGFCE